jgi:hypothetical protein
MLKLLLLYIHIGNSYGGWFKPTFRKQMTYETNSLNNHKFLH